MYNISSEALALFKNNYRQVVNITFRKGNRVFTLTEADIRQGGFSIDRYSVSGSKIEIGSAVAAELVLTLENNDDRFSNEIFEGGELEVKVGIKKWDAYKWENAQIHWIPCGFFTIDDQPRKLASITLTALDRMVKFDTLVPNNLFPNTVENLIRNCCSSCGVSLASNLSSLPNKNYLVTYTPDEDEELTCRQVLQWVAEITGTCVFIDWNGQLRVQWYENTSTIITSSERYKSDMYETDIQITGVQFTDDDDNVYLAGTDDYAFDLSGNKFITHDIQDVVNALNSRLSGFSYRPYSATIKPMPHIYPMDRLTYVDKDGVSHNTILTNTTFKLNNSTVIAGKGETVKKKSYARANPLNRQESIAIQKVKKQMSDSEHRITQSFIAADGLLESIITEEITRATGEEATLSSRITQTAESITAEVTRATTAEGTLSSRITQTAEDITAEVTRATGEEATLSSRITQTAESITAEVTRATTAEGTLSSRITQTAESITAEVTRATTAEGTLSSRIEANATAITAKVSATGGTDSSFSWSLTSSGFVLKSNNTTVMQVTRSGLVVSGEINGLSGSIGGFTIGTTYLYSDQLIMGYLQTGGVYHPAIGVGAWNNAHTSFTATATMLDDKIIATNGILKSVVTEELSVSNKLSVNEFRADRILAPKSISSTTGFYFGYSGGSVRYHAVLSWGSGSRILWLKIYDSSGNQIALTESKTFEVHYACIWGGDTTWNATVGAGSSSTSKDTGAFWGIDYATFDTSVSNKSNHTYYFTISGSPASKVITSRGDIVPWYGNEDDLGSASYRFNNIYLHTSPNVDSDRNHKNSIAPLSSAYETFFDALKPVSYKYNENSNNRTHTGFIAQEMKEAIVSAGLSTQELAAYCEWLDENGNTGCGIRYEELIALCVHEIQKLKEKIKMLESTGGSL